MVWFDRAPLAAAGSWSSPVDVEIGPRQHRLLLNDARVKFLVQWMGGSTWQSPRPGCARTCPAVVPSVSVKAVANGQGMRR